MAPSGDDTPCRPMTMTIKSANVCTTWACHNAGGQQQPPHCHADLSLVKWFTTVPLQPFFVILVPGCGPEPQTNITINNVHQFLAGTTHAAHIAISSAEPNLQQMLSLQCEMNQRPSVDRAIILGPNSPGAFHVAMQPLGGYSSWDISSAISEPACINMGVLALLAYHSRWLSLASQRSCCRPQLKKMRHTW